MCDYEGILAGCLQKSRMPSVIDTYLIVTTILFVVLSCRHMPGTVASQLACCMTLRPI